MADPLRHEEPSATDEGRDTRIEELLLAGLDHYFNGQHELAISVWTRVLFLDRGHARARAYIERARSAVAERHREGEELLHSGMAAFQRGDAGDARQLLNSALDRGVSRDEALALLDRLDRIAPIDVAPEPQPSLRWDPTGRAGGAFRGIQLFTLVLVLAIGVAAGAAVMIYLDSAGVPWRASASGPSAVSRMPVEALPLPSPPDLALRRARVLRDADKLKEALAALEIVPAGDPARAAADELRAVIQAQLLEAAHASQPPSVSPSGASVK